LFSPISHSLSAIATRWSVGYPFEKLDMLTARIPRGVDDCR
jgi:hypothetical protein